MRNFWGIVRWKIERAVVKRKNFLATRNWEIENHLPSTASRSRAIATHSRATRICIRATAADIRETGINWSEIATYIREIVADIQEMAVNIEEIGIYRHCNAAESLEIAANRRFPTISTGTPYFPPLQPPAP